MRLETREKGEVTIITLFGNIKTSDDYGLFKDTIEGVLRAGKNKVILDCKEIHFINSSGLGRLILASKRINETGGALKIISLSDELKELFTFTMLDTKIRVYDSEKDALASF